MTPLILVVDDDPAVRATLARGLTRYGYEVACAATADDAYALLDDPRVELLILDLWLQHLAGDVLALAILRQWPRMAGKIILMSGDPVALERRRAEGTLSFPVLNKPFDLSQVYQLIDEVLAPGSGRRRNGTELGQP